MKHVKWGAAALALLLTLCLAGCGGYSSHYKTVGCVRTNTEEHVSLSFYEFEGTIVFKMKLKNQSEAALKYAASLEEGEMAVSYDYAGLKQPLLTVRGGESLEETGGYAETGTVYVILESTGKCVNGSFDFTFTQDTP